MAPLSLNVAGSTQPEVFAGTVAAMVQELMTNASQFWQEALAKDGPIEIWEIRGEKWLFNGTHRYQAALQTGTDIPADHIKVVDRIGSTIPTWRFDQITWLPGLK